MIAVSFPNKSTPLLQNFECTERAFNEEVIVRPFLSVINNEIDLVFFSRIKYLPRRNGDLCNYIAWLQGGMCNPRDITSPISNSQVVTSVTVGIYNYITCTSSWLYVIPISDLTVASTHNCIIYFQGKYYLKTVYFSQNQKRRWKRFSLVALQNCEHTMQLAVCPNIGMQSS